MLPRFWLLLSSFAFFLIGIVLTETNDGVCDGINRLSCRNWIEADKCGLLDACTRFWKEIALWKTFRNDLSAKCSYCNFIVGRNLKGSGRSFDLTLNRICAQHHAKDKCKLLISSLYNIDDFSVQPHISGASGVSQMKTGVVLCNLLSSCNSTIYLGNLNFGNSGLCDDCKRIIEDVRKLVADNATADALSSKLKSLLCAPLPDEWRDYCGNNIEIHVPYLLRLIEKNINSNAICSSIYLCPESLGNSFKELYRKTLISEASPRPCPPRTKFSWINPPSSFTGGVYTSEVGKLQPDCGQCQSVVDQMKKVLADPDMEERISNTVINAVCHGIPFCATEIKSKVDSILTQLQYVGARDICAFFGMCSEPVVVTQNQSLMQPAIPIPGVCEVCELVIERLVNMLTNNATFESITKCLDEVCSYIPHSYRTKCISLVDSYGAKIAEAMLNGLAPKLICSSLGVCYSPVSSPAYNQAPSTCPICKGFINLLYDALLLNSTEEEMKELLKKECALLPSTYALKCNELVETYWEPVLKYLERELPAEVICEKIRLCPAPGGSCQDASYYCSSLPIAIECRAVELCQTLGYQSDLFFSVKAQVILNVLDDYCAGIRKIPLIDKMNHVVPIVERLTDNHTICSKFVQRWLLERNIFGRPTVNVSECNLYVNDKLAHLQCILTVKHHDELIKASVGNNGNHKKSCQDVLNQLFALELLVMSMKAKPSSDISFEYVPTIRLSTADNKSIGTEGVCEDCEVIMKYVKVHMKDEQFIKLVKKLLEKYICMESETCTSRINRWVDELQIIVDTLDARFLCQALRLCPSYELPVTKEVSSFPGKCQICEAVVAKLLEMTVGNETEQELVAIMALVCNKLPASFQDRCFSLVESFGPKIAEAIVRGYGSEAVCELLGLCDSFARLHQQIHTKLPKEVPLPSRSIACDTCQSVVSAIYNQLAQNKTKEELINVVKEGCNILPQSIRLQCSALVDHYLGAIVDYFERQYTPRQVCEELAICPASNNQKLTQSGSCHDISHKCSNLETALKCNAIYECYSLGFKSNLRRYLPERRTNLMFDNICSTLVHMEDRDMQNWVLQDRMQLFLRLISHHQGEQALGSYTRYNDECNFCLEVFEMWKLHHNIPSDRGTKGNLCQKFAKGQQQRSCKSIWNRLESTGTSKIDPTENGEQFCQRDLKCAQLPGLKVNETVESLQNCKNPSYWCSSRSAAKACNKIFYCKTQGLLQHTLPQSANEKCVDVFDQDCCSWGPTYYCQSAETAEQCGDLALKHCQTYVWTESTSTTTKATVTDNMIAESTQNHNSFCSRGPIFWCQSPKNAILCGPIAVHYCRNFHSPLTKGS